MLLATIYHGENAEEKITNKLSENSLKKLTNEPETRYNNFCLFGVISLLLKVQELVSRQQPVELKGTLDTSEIFRNSPEYTPLKPLEYDVTAQATDGRIVVSGRISSSIRMQCSRCLDPVDERIDIPFEEHFRIVKDGEAELNEDDEAVPVTGERIDLEPLLAEELMVQLPYAPLCKEDCKGLCPKCGTNWNEQSCGCKTASIDPRLAALQDWLKPEQE
jgi:uncharacterized protein